MEYVIVHYPVARNVFIDGQHVGETGQTLEVETGHHRFSLGDTQDYTPASQDIEVSNTNPIIPMQIIFTPAGDA